MRLEKSAGPCQRLNLIPRAVGSQEEGAVQRDEVI